MIRNGIRDDSLPLRKLPLSQTWHALACARVIGKYGR
jgi:hypothetical protein